MLFTLAFSPVRERRLSRSMSERAFTLIELLTVIAIIGILAGILIPTVGAVKVSANKSRTKVQFSQWGTAMSLFKQEYGYYPTIQTMNKVVPAKLAGALTAKSLAGVAITSTADANLCGNTKLLSFYAIADNELDDATNPLNLVDAFGNTDIAIFVDSNGDGKIDTTDTPALSLQSVTSLDGVPWPPTATQINLTTGVRAGVIFYSAGKGASVNDIVFSWQ